MPVMHDSEDWQSMVKDVATLKGDVRAIRSDFATQTKVQDERHDDNQDRFKELESEIQNVRSEVSELKDVILEAKGVLQGIKTAAHILKWLLGVAIAMQTLYMLFGPNIRKSVGLPASTSQPPAVSENQMHNQQSAHIPTL